jgi:hypothetical protein
MSGKYEPEPNWLFDEEAWDEKHSLRKKPPTQDPDDPEPVDDRLTY